MKYDRLLKQYLHHFTDDADFFIKTSGLYQYFDRLQQVL